MKHITIIEITASAIQSLLTTHFYRIALFSAAIEAVPAHRPSQMQAHTLFTTNLYEQVKFKFHEYILKELKILISERYAELRLASLKNAAGPIAGAH